MPQVKFDPLARLHRIEDYARDAPKSAEKRIATLAAYLTRYCRSDEQKALAIYAWITSHINYDDYSAEHDEVRLPQDPKTVLALHKGVCEGYSRLFAALCEAAGVPAVYVGGYAKSWDKVQVDEDDAHAWNAVYWNKQWHLVDSTWGEDYLEESRRYPPQYFDIDPEKLLASHFPDEPKWQLRTRPPMTRKEFDQQCLREPEFFELGLELLDTTAYEMVVDQECTLRLKVPNEVQLRVSLECGDIRQGRDSVLVSRRGELRAIEVRPPKPGRYRVIFWADGKHVLTYHVQTRQASSGYPEQWEAYQEREALVQEPLEGVLKKRRQHFRLSVPQARKVYLRSGETDFALTKTGDDFEGDFTPVTDSVEVWLEPEGVSLFGRSRWPLLNYRVQ